MTAGLLTPAGAASGAHEWSIWCRGFNNSAAHGRVWEATVEVMAAAAGAPPAVLMALAEPSPVFSRETLVTVLALVVAVPVTGLAYSLVMLRHAGRTGRLKPVYPACTAVAAQVTTHRRQDGAGVLKATAILFATAMVGWAAWQRWFAVPAGEPTGFVMRWADTTLGYIALIGLEAPLLGLLPLRFMDGRSLWRWSKPAWLIAYGLCLSAFVIVLMDFGATGSDWSALLTAILLFAGFGLLSVAFWPSSPCVAAPTPPLSRLL